MAFGFFDKGLYTSKSLRDKLKNIDPSEVKNILVIRHAALGDLVLTRPFLVEARKLFPNAKITLNLVSHYQVGAPLDLVDDIKITHGQNMRDASLKSRFRNLKESTHYDILFDLCSTSRSLLISILTKARLKMCHSYHKNLFVYDVNFHRSDYMFEAETMLQFLNLFGHSCQYPLDFQWYLHDKKTASKRISYFAGASSVDKCLPLDRFRQVILAMAKMFPDYEHVVIEGARSGEDFPELIRDMPQSVSLRPKSDIDELAKWLSKSSLLISNDTGVRNVALATHTPTVGIFFGAAAFRYVPSYEHIHKICFELDHSPPSADSVVHTATDLIHKTYT